MKHSSGINMGDYTGVIPWWKNENRKTVAAKRCHDEGSSSDIVVRQHTRKRFKVSTAIQDVGPEKKKK